MTPIEKAAEVYLREPCARTFQEDLKLHLLYGYVISTPRLFIMGRPVVKGAPASEIVDPSFTFPEALCNCWHIYLAAGNGIQEFFRVEPFELPWLSWERKNILRYHRRDAILRSAAIPATSVLARHPSLQRRFRPSSSKAAEAGKAKNP